MIKEKVEISYTTDDFQLRRLKITILSSFENLTKSKNTNEEIGLIRLDKWLFD
jgi:hypothetical protein